MRQEGDWYIGFAKPVHDRVSIWAAGQGEHFDDRPSGHRPLSIIRASLLPTDPTLQASGNMFSTESASATRILRGGAGFSIKPFAPLSIHSAAGVVDDRRIGQQAFGMTVHWISNMSLPQTITAWISTATTNFTGSFSPATRIVRNYRRD
jgi:hypothetical protein